MVTYLTMSGERVFINPPWELADQIGQHLESCRRTAPTTTMAVFDLPKWAKFNQLTKHMRGICQENGCSLIHPGSWLTRLDSILRVAVEPLQQLRWLFCSTEMGKVQSAH
jgi:hypothetical protein